MTYFLLKFEIWAVQRIANLVDLEKCWKMSIWLQKSALIQKRTSCLKFAEASKRYHPPVKNLALTLQDESGPAQRPLGRAALVVTSREVRHLSEIRHPWRRERPRPAVAGRRTQPSPPPKSPTSIECFSYQFLKKRTFFFPISSERGGKTFFSFKITYKWKWK